MLKSKSMCKILTLLLLLLSLILYLTSTEVNATEIEYVPAGYITPTGGYFISEQAGRDILEGWTSDRLAKETYKAALDNSYLEWQEFKTSMEQQIQAIRNDIADERAAFKAELRKAKRPGIGVFAGPVYTTDGDFRVAIGIGFVYKVFQ